MGLNRRIGVGDNIRHSDTLGRGEANQHPISSIENLSPTLIQIEGNVSGNTSAIADNTESINNNNNRITANQNNIETNQSNISTNQNNITTNTNNISNNVTAITQNQTGISNLTTSLSQLATNKDTATNGQVLLSNGDGTGTFKNFDLVGLKKLIQTIDITTPTNIINIDFDNTLYSNIIIEGVIKSTSTQWKNVVMYYNNIRASSSYKSTSIDILNNNSPTTSEIDIILNDDTKGPLIDIGVYVNISIDLDTSLTKFSLANKVNSALYNGLAIPVSNDRINNIKIFVSNDLINNTNLKVYGITI